MHELRWLSTNISYRPLPIKQVEKQHKVEINSSFGIHLLEQNLDVYLKHLLPQKCHLVLNLNDKIKMIFTRRPLFRI